MQPQQLIDWLRKLHLHADAALAAKRWNLSKAFCASANAEDCYNLIRAFLFAEPSSETLQYLTDRFVKIDTEFPSTNNTEEIRLMAGVTMLAARGENVQFAVALATGLHAASFPAHRCSPYESLVSQLVAEFVFDQAESLRGATYDFSNDAAAVSTSLAADTAQQNLAAANPKSAIVSVLGTLYGQRIQRLSEESGVLWWLLGGVSDGLGKDRKDLAVDEYALVVADEAATRIQLLPPPSSMPSILGRALSECKGFKKKKCTLKDFIATSDENWRKTFLKKFNSQDGLDLVPFITALRKFEDAGDVTVLAKALSKTCPGVSSDLAVTEIEAARQLFNEIIFARAVLKLP